MLDYLEDLLQAEVICGLQASVLATPGQWLAILAERLELQ